MVAEARAGADASDPGNDGRACSTSVQWLGSSVSYRISSPLALTLRSTGLGSFRIAIDEDRRHGPDDCLPYGCATITKSLEIQRSEFVLVNVDGAGRISLVESNRVPLVTGQGYGWQIFLETDKPRIRWREEFTLPRAPEIWGQGETPVFLSADRRTAVTEQEVDASRGVIGHAWSVAPGDPAGRYVIRVFVEGQLAATFEFDVQ
jgi:hypothetical protein